METPPISLKKLSEIPSNPDADYIKLYANDAGSVFCIDEDGNITLVSGGDGGNWNTFTDANLTDGVLSWEHSLGQEIVDITILDNNNEEVTPEKVDCVDENNCDIYLVGWGTLTGTWKILGVIGETGSGLENPMTTAGDVIYGGTSGTPTRLATGTAGQVLTVNSGATAPEWADASSGAIQNVGFAELDTGADFEESAGSWRPIYLKKIDLGALPNTTTKDVAHGVSNLSSWVSLYGMLVTGDGYARPLPYVATTSSACVGLYQGDASNITVATGTDRTSWNGTAYLQYTKTTDTPTSSPRNS